MTARNCVLIVLAVFACAPRSDESAERTDTAGGDQPDIGYLYPPLPAGATDLGGWMITATMGNGELHPLGVHHLILDGARQVWLGRLAERDSAGRATWELLQSLTLPETEQPSRLVSSCAGPGGEFDGRLFGLAAPTEAEFHTQLFHAWSVDIDARAMVPVSPDSLRCHNEGYGL